MNFREALEKKEFVITAEIFPPKGTDLNKFKQKADILKPLVDAVNVTDNQRAVMRISSLAASVVLKEKGLHPIYQITCRDRNRLALQSDLLGAWALGVETVLALSGDYPTNGDHPQAKPVYDLDTIQLIQAIAVLNQGKDLAGNELKGKTDYLIGGVCNPVYDNMDLQYIMINKKIMAGVKFFQTQAVFSVEKYKEFLQTAGRKDIRFLAGILPLKSAKMARMLNEKVPGIFIPEDIIQDMEKAPDPLQRGLEIAAQIIKELKNTADGVHIMAINFEEKIPDLLRLADIK